MQMIGISAWLYLHGHIWVAICCDTNGNRRSYKILVIVIYRGRCFSNSFCEEETGIKVNTVCRLIENTWLAIFTFRPYMKGGVLFLVEERSVHNHRAPKWNKI